MEEDLEIKDKTTTEQCARDELDEYAEMLDQAQIQTNQIQKQQTSNISIIINEESRIVDHKFQILNTASRLQGIQEDELKYKKQKSIQNAESDDAKLVALNIGYGDATGDFKDRCAGKRPELVKMIREPPPTPILYSDTKDNKEMEARATTTLSSGAVKKGTPGASQGEEAVSTGGGGPKALAFSRIFLLNPPPLITAVFPWNRDKGSAAAEGNGAEDSAFAKGKVEYVVNGGSNANICVVAMVEDEAAVVGDDAATTVERRRTLVQNGGKEEKVLLPASSGASTAGSMDSHDEQGRRCSGGAMTVPFIVNERLGVTDDRDNRRSVISDSLEVWWEGGAGRGAWRKMDDGAARVCKVENEVRARMMWELSFFLGLTHSFKAQIQILQQYWANLKPLHQHYWANYC
ncbi:hypothetical protein PIB30_055787 [Stylosanthes scabra]|uniref:Uncharacterized protein n=1 Tax=Stylosanthes scabra TaxID=79078 RepID=A0ABU6ZHX5_9FABA|nr:hypothetical protein [Stylosanthes scabra]